MILIFGSTGMLGNYLFKYLNKFYKIDSINRNNFDVYKLYIKTEIIETLEILLEKYKPKYIINCIGNILKKNDNSDGPKKQYIINSYFPIVLSIICKKHNITFINKFLFILFIKIF